MQKRIFIIGLIFLLLFSAIVPIGMGYGTNMSSNVSIINKSEELGFVGNNIGKKFDGYTLFTPWFSTNTYLINNKGRVVHKWKSDYMPAIPVYLLKNGNLLRGDYAVKPDIIIGNGDTGRVEMFDWDGNKIWDFVYASDQYCLHHDIEPLPNGNILMISWEAKTRYEAINAGCNPDLIKDDIVWPDKIMEVKPTGNSGGNIVWEWHVWDHMIQDYDPLKENYGAVGDHPELIDINFMAQDKYRDWTHINSIDYNENFDQILLSTNVLNEIWIIDHSTTTMEATGHTGGKSGNGGDLLYRWGNPQSYRAGDIEDKKFYGQHDARWIKPGCPGEGHITVFHNGFIQPGDDYSSVFEIIPPVDNNGSYYLETGFAYGPEVPIWTYTARKPTNFYAAGQSAALRLPNGNTMICNSQGYFFEVTPEKKIVWLYINPFPRFIGNTVFTFNCYPSDYSGIGNLSISKENIKIESENTFSNTNSILADQNNRIMQKNSIRFFDYFYIIKEVFL